VSGNSLGASGIAADPIRPFAYVAQTTFDGATSTFNGALSVYNFHTGQLIDKLNFPGRMMTGVEVSPDGQLLILADAANSTDASDRFLIPINLNGSTRTVRPRWGGIRLGIQYSHYKIAEIGGAAVVLTGERQIVSVANGAVLGEFETDAVGAFPFPFTGKVAFSADGGTALLLGDTADNHRLARYRLTHLNNTFRVLETHNINETGNGIDVASNPAGTHFITLSAADNTPLRAYDSATLTLTKSGAATLPGDQSMDLAGNGDIYVTGVQSSFAQYDSNFVLRGSRTFGFTTQALFGRVSADGERTVVVTSGTSGVADVHLNFFDSQLPL
jgi:DNA-binding beta-propeller fold protein YncE